MRKLFAALAAVAIVLASSASTAGAQDETRIALLHGIPGVDVDVEVAGTIVFQGLSFQSTEDVSSFAGQTLPGVLVKVSGTDDVAIDAGDLTLPSSGHWTIIAHLDENGDPTISTFENDTSTIAAGNGRLELRHTAAAPAVDVKTNGEVTFPSVSNGDSVSADVPAGQVEAAVVPAGADEPVVIGPAPLPIVEGTSLIVYAIGSLADDNVDVITETITGLAGAPDAVNTGTSPVDDGSGSVLVTAMALVAVLAAGALVLRRATR